MQNLNFEEKESLLRRSFPMLAAEDAHHALEAAQGDQDMAAAMLLEIVLASKADVSSPHVSARGMPCLTQITASTGQDGLKG